MGGVQGNGWSDPGFGTPHVDPVAATVQADRIEQPARFILRSERGEEIQTYPLDKGEISIGRAPTSDISLAKDKLTSRRHATVHYENGNYYLRDEGSANNTFVNGQQIETLTPLLLHDGDHVGIGEHELIFRSFGAANTAVEDMPTISVQYDPDADKTVRMDGGKVAQADEFLTKPMPEPATQIQQEHVDAPVAQPVNEDVTAMAPNIPPAPVVAPSVPVPVPTSFVAPTPAPTFGTSAPVGTPAVQQPPSPPPATPLPPIVQQTPVAVPPPKQDPSDANVTFSRLTSTQQPTLPDMTALMAALSTLDGQVMSLQEQFHATQEAMQSHEAEIARTTNQLRIGVRRVSERMDSTIADVARGRESLGWVELLQLMEDVMNNPRDIEYVTKLARKARELNKIFQIQQNVLNTMAECNSLLRSMIGEEK
jgi:pSer/pThr/pTyr-binding forkhead associated (FHA) protein